MINVGDIYYFSDQFGPNFVKILMIGDIWTKDENWVFFYKSSSLSNIIRASYPENDIGCDKAQVKRWHFEKLIDKFTYSSHFKGCIKIDNDLIQKMKEGKESDVIHLISNDPNKYPYIEVIGSVLSGYRVSCKRISKQDFRNLKLNKILE